MQKNSKFPPKIIQFGKKLLDYNITFAKTSNLASCKSCLVLSSLVVLSGLVILYCLVVLFALFWHQIWKKIDKVQKGMGKNLPCRLFANVSAVIIGTGLSFGIVGLDIERYLKIKKFSGKSGWFMR